DGWALAYWNGLTGKLPWCAAGRLPEEISARDALQQSLAGRLFAPSGELRWRVLPMLGEHCCRTVYLGSPGWAPAALSTRSDLQDCRLRASSETVLLWGQQTKRTPDEWVELRIPHRFRYPVEPLDPGSGRVGVHARIEVWRDPAGEVHFVRLCDLQAFPEK